MDICIGMSAINPAIAALLCNTCCFHPGICYSGHPHPQLLNATLQCKAMVIFLETIRVNSMEGQLAKPCPGLGSRTGIPTAALFLLGMLIGRMGLF